jgi:hypothetical protein
VDGRVKPGHDAVAGYGLPEARFRAARNDVWRAGIAVFGGVVGRKWGMIYCMVKMAEPQFIETTAGEIAAELARLGVAADQRVTVAVQPDDWLTEVRQVTRPRVIAEGWSDADIDRVIDQERDHLQQRLG